MYGLVSSGLEPLLTYVQKDHLLGHCSALAQRLVTLDIEGIFVIVRRAIGPLYHIEEAHNAGAAHCFEREKKTISVKCCSNSNVQ